MRDGAVVRIGKLTFDGPAATSLKNGQFVTVSGRYVAGQAQPKVVALDTLFPNPALYFGPSVKHLMVEAFIKVADDGVWMNGQRLTPGPNLRGQPGPARIAVVSLERAPDGNYTAARLRYTDYRGATYRGAGPGAGEAPPPPPLPPLPDKQPFPGNDDSTVAPADAQPEPGVMSSIAGGAHADGLPARAVIARSATPGPLIAPSTVITLVAGAVPGNGTARARPGP